MRFATDCWPTTSLLKNSDFGGETTECVEFSLLKISVPQIPFLSRRWCVKELDRYKKIDETIFPWPEGKTCFRISALC
jgi:hypothetical protein